MQVKTPPACLLKGYARSKEISSVEKMHVNMDLKKLESYLKVVLTATLLYTYHQHTKQDQKNIHKAIGLLLLSVPLVSSIHEFYEN